jgi:hypothetical protein
MNPLAEVDMNWREKMVPEVKHSNLIALLPTRVASRLPVAVVRGEAPLTLGDLAVALGTVGDEVKTRVETKIRSTLRIPRA